MGNVRIATVRATTKTKKKRDFNQVYRTNLHTADDLDCEQLALAQTVGIGSGQERILRQPLFVSTRWLRPRHQHPKSLLPLPPRQQTLPFTKSFQHCTTKQTTVAPTRRILFHPLRSQPRVKQVQTRLLRLPNPTPFPPNLSPQVPPLPPPPSVRNIILLQHYSKPKTVF